LKRGDVVIAATGSGFGSKPRPYVVIQSDAFETANVILAGFTTGNSGPADFRPRLHPTKLNGLAEASDVMIDIPVTASRAKVAYVAGRLTAEELAEVDTALLLILGLADLA